MLSWSLDVLSKVQVDHCYPELRLECHLYSDARTLKRAISRTRHKAVSFLFAEIPSRDRTWSQKNLLTWTPQGAAQK